MRYETPCARDMSLAFGGGRSIYELVRYWFRGPSSMTRKIRVLWLYVYFISLIELRTVLHLQWRSLVMTRCESRHGALCMLPQLWISLRCESCEIGFRVRVLSIHFFCPLWDLDDTKELYIMLKSSNNLVCVLMRLKHARNYQALPLPRRGKKEILLHCLHRSHITSQCLNRGH